MAVDPMSVTQVIRYSKNKTLKHKVKEFGFFEWFFVLVVIAIIFAIILPMKDKWTEFFCAKHAIKLSNALVDAQQAQLKNFGKFSNTFKLDVKDFNAEAAPPNPKCKHGGCMHVKGFSYQYDNEANIIVTRESDKELSQYYFVYPIAKTRPALCVSANEKAANMCESVGAVYSYGSSDGTIQYFKMPQK